MAGVIEECDPDEKLPTPSEFVMRGTLAAPNTTRSYLCDRHWDWYKVRAVGPCSGPPLHEGLTGHSCRRPPRCHRDI